MTPQANILSRFSGTSDGRPFYLPDLTLWYRWHHSWLGGYCDVLCQARHA
mgnify:CR=1 FL=1